MVAPPIRSSPVSWKGKFIWQFVFLLIFSKVNGFFSPFFHTILVHWPYHQVSRSLATPVKCLWDRFSNTPLPFLVMAKHHVFSDTPFPIIFFLLLGAIIHIWPMQGMIQVSGLKNATFACPWDFPATDSNNGAELPPIPTMGQYSSPEYQRSDMVYSHWADSGPLKSESQ